MNMDHVYCHELFQRGKPHLLKDIKRKNSDNSTTTEKSLNSFENHQAKQDLAAVVHENVILKKLNQETLARVCILESKIKELTIQNQALWNQIYQQHEKAEALKNFITGVIKQHGIHSSNLPPNLRNEFTLSPIHQIQETLSTNSSPLIAQTSTKLVVNDNPMNLELISNFNNDKTVNSMNSMNFEDSSKSNTPPSFVVGQQTQNQQKNGWTFDFEFIKLLSQANSQRSRNTHSEKNSEKASFQEEHFEEEKSNSKKKRFEKPKQTTTKNIHKLDDKHYYQKIDRVPLKKTIIDGENNERLRVCKTEDGIEEDEDSNLTRYSTDFSPVQIIEIKNEGLN